MQIVSVRFGPEQIELVQREAEADGRSASQYIRDAAYSQAVISAARRNRTTVQMWNALILAVEAIGHDEISASLRDLLEDVESDAERAARRHDEAHGG